MDQQGKISRAAFVGEKIWLERAREDLAQSLDVRRQKISTNPRPIDDKLNQDLQATQARNTELKAELARRKLAVESGTIMRVEEFERKCAKELAALKADREYECLSQGPFCNVRLGLAKRLGWDQKALPAISN